MYVIVDLDFLGTVSASGSYIQNIAFVPIRVIDFIEFVFPRIEEVSGVHDIFEEGIDGDVGGQVDYFN